MDIYCGVPGCSRPLFSKALCRSHYGQKYRGASFTSLRPREYPQCAISSCEVAAVTKGYCVNHYTISNKYKVGLARLNELLSTTECELCGKPLGSKFPIDHDHACCGPDRGCNKCVRGALCFRCNTGLSAYEEPKWIARAEAYLSRHQAGL